MNRAKYEQSGKLLDEASEILKEVVLNESMWTSLVPNTEVEKLELNLLVNNIYDDNEDKLTEDINAFNITNRKEGNCVAQFALEINPNHVISPSLDLMNSDQQLIFYLVRKWCVDKINGKQPDPLCLFISGSGGVGKSFLIQCLVHEVNKLFGQFQDNTNSVIQTLAPTGIAALPINGTTIHNYFSLSPQQLTMPYVPLGQAKLNTLRNKMSNLKILIIDEISMVSETILAYINGRLCQVMQTLQPFGKVSIITLGDFYQLPPVKGIALYRNFDSPLSLWNNFTMFTLDKVIRQKNEEFASMLNRFRKHSKGQPLQDGDIQILLNRSTVEKPTDALRVYAKNIDVHAYNEKKLGELDSQIIVIKAMDKVLRDSNSKAMLIKSLNDCLPVELKLAVNARVILLKNLSVSDGLVNGSLGTITKILPTNSETNMPAGVCIRFDDSRVGVLSRQENVGDERIPEGSVLVLPFQETALNFQASRTQFPLRIAYAVTIHKTQGMTCDSIVLSLKDIFLPGMAYVALSRTKTLEGLFIEGFNRNNPKIYCNEYINVFLASMPRTDIRTVMPLEKCKNKLIIVHHNVEGLKNNLKGVFNNFQIKLGDIFIATESWINTDNVNVNISGYNCYHKQRRNCKYYDKNAIRGGVSIYIKDTILNYELKCFEVLNMTETVCIYFNFIDLYIFGCYRSPSYNIHTLCESFKKLFETSDVLNSRYVSILGDFNENLLNSKENHTFYNFLISHGFTQLISEPTTCNNTLLDVVFFKGNNNLESGVLQSYNSYHLPIYLALQK